MAESILKLKKRALAAGMPKADAIKADRSELEDFIASTEKKPSSTKPAKKAVAKKKGKTAARKPAAKKPAAKPKAAAKKTTARKTSTKRATTKRNENGGGRLAIDRSGIDWNVESDDWNPRKGGPVELLFKALKKSKGNIDKAFDLLVGDIYEFVGKKKRDGSKRTKADAEAMLRYRLNRTLFEFAVRTGQHESSTERVEYGTGAYATTRKKRATRKPSGGKKATAKKGAKKGTRRKK